MRKFHGHELSTHRGSTYNCYLIRDENTVLVDTVWGPFQDQLIDNIREIVDPAKIDIDIVVANHAEVDHSGGLHAVMRHALGAAFGCYGWSGESVKIIENHLTESKIGLVREAIKSKWQPDAEDLEACRTFGKELGEATNKPSG